MRKRMRKKGVETNTVIIWVILAIVVAGLVIIGPTKLFNYVSGLFEFAPESLELAVTACNGYVDAGAKISYCGFREIKHDGKKQLVNCPGVLQIAGSLADFENKNAWCGEDMVELAKEECKKHKDEQIVNDKICCKVADSVCDDDLEINWGCSKDHTEYCPEDAESP